MVSPLAASSTAKSMVQALDVSSAEALYVIPSTLMINLVLDSLYAVLDSSSVLEAVKLIFTLFSIPYSTLFPVGALVSSSAITDTVVGLPAVV